MYDHGFRLPGPLFAAFCLARTGPEAAEGPRLGLTVPRAVGKANIRNRIKRRLREVVRKRRVGLGTQWDIVLNPRRMVETAPFGDIERALEKVIGRCNSHS